jgi:hypothetical protein
VYKSWCVSSEIDAVERLTGGAGWLAWRGAGAVDVGVQLVHREPMWRLHGTHVPKVHVDRVYTRMGKGADGRTNVVPPGPACLRLGDMTA